MPLIIICGSVFPVFQTRFCSGGRSLPWIWWQQQGMLCTSPGKRTLSCCQQLFWASVPWGLSWMWPCNVNQPLTCISNSILQPWKMWVEPQAMCAPLTCSRNSKYLAFLKDMSGALRSWAYTSQVTLIFTWSGTAFVNLAKCFSTWVKFKRILLLAFVS